LNGKYIYSNIFHYLWKIILCKYFPLANPLILKEQIVQASLTQFLKFGIRKMTIQKLVEPMGISTKTVYKYFSNKEDLLKECISLHYSRLFEKSAEAKNDSASPVVTIFKMLHGGIKIDFGSNHLFYHDLNYYYPQLQDNTLKKYASRYQEDFFKLLEDGMVQGYFRKDILPNVVLEIITGMYASITRTKEFKKFKLPPLVVFKNTIEVYLRGICTVKGLKELDKNYISITK
jgi:AcrR family transcriptional regulator